MNKHTHSDKSRSWPTQLYNWQAQTVKTGERLGSSPEVRLLQAKGQLSPLGSLCVTPEVFQLARCGYSITEDN